MTVKGVLQGDIPELRTKSAEVTSFDTNLASLLTDLIDTVTAHRGLGLSAPQIGMLERVFVVDLGDGIQEFVNPQIIEASGEVDGAESCMSFPGHTLKVTRPQTIKVQAQDRTGQSFQIEASDLLARVVAHEIDHLDGVLFMDHLSEENLFSQLLVSAFEFDDGDDDNEMNEELQLSETEQKARQQELELSIDMLSEISWKLTLSLEILKDYRDVFGEAIAWNELEKIVDLLDDTIQIVEKYS
ncbi:peptide deformylase [Alicyclobacillus fastidiosus]|uniref:Peptide deformylase n=1 Tax=Alicyclobacillus fastidiosus TaxID=392011 RepID=A0ABY6ZEA4_9BACL|nr:peptide deformylase [Alicyclobacillus fastidiosus]WAH41065.1 peptide deformylase [Alicyclobacillus fastidiosus]GMA62604.1 hypothetical protein GCM10025859_30440 [Alicyclobacillus fastidiosus]